MAGAFGLFTCYVLTLPPAAPRKTIVRLGGLSWTREDFCRGWLITGDTGSGKTRSGITPLLYQIFKNEPGWGGVCIDDKGLYWETLSEMAAHFNRQSDLILLQVKPDNAAPSWRPLHTYNLTSDRTIPSSTYAKFVVDTASSLGQQGDKGFFKNQAHTHIAKALDTLYEIRADVTLENVYSLLLDEADMEEALSDLLNVIRRNVDDGLDDHFKNRFLESAARADRRCEGNHRELSATLSHSRDQRRSSVLPRTRSTSATSTAGKSSASPCRRSSRPNGDT